MRPGKKDKNGGDESKPQMEQIQADHEQFLEAFEKPTQIYRYIRARHLISPTFLHRNLSYMKERSRRKKATRVGFKLDSLLVSAEDRYNKTSYSQPDGIKLNITGLFDKSSQSQTAELEAFLTKTCNGKRKISSHEITSSSVTEVCIGKTVIPCNPDNKMQPISLPVGSEKLQGNCDSSPGQSYTLHMRVRCPYTSTANGSSKLPHLQEDEPHPLKRRKSRSGILQDEDGLPSLASLEEADAEPRIYGAQLVMFDSQRRCPLTDGDYELVLADMQQEAAHFSHQKPSAWHVVSGGKTIDQTAVFSICPTLKFNLSWQHPPGEKMNEVVKDIKKELVNKENTENVQLAPSPSKKKRIFYQFMYNNNTCQQTEARDDTTCPWCLMDCLAVYALIKHLRTCHPRFLFTYSEHPKGARIDVSINEHYDGSYSGNPHDLYSYMGYAFCRQKPVQRMPVTQVIVCRPPKLLIDLSEFEDANTCEEHVPRPMVAGHNRLYFHTITCSLQWPSEIDNDSDGEMDPQWLRQKTQNLIDDFTDVNEGEKEIMKMWNLHVMHHNFIGDCQIPKACADFVQEYGPRVIQLDLAGNFMLHLVNLYDFGIIKPELIYRTMMQLFRLQYKMKQGEERKEGFEEQLSNYNADMMDTDCDEEVASVVGS